MLEVIGERRERRLRLARFSVADGRPDGCTIKPGRPSRKSPASGNWRSKGGRPPTRDWESLYGWAARRVHDQGLPASQAELVREALDWLGAQGDDALPDESTVRRKLAGFWRALVSPAH